MQTHLERIRYEKYGGLSQPLFDKRCLLLANVFEKVIDRCLKFYVLDPCHYFSSSGLSWDPMLKMTAAKLEKISDIDMYLLIH